MTRLQWVTLTALAANGVLMVTNGVLLHRNTTLYRHWLAIMETLPPHACGEVIEPHETCSMTFVIPLPSVPGAPAGRPLPFRKP